MCVPVLSVYFNQDDSRASLCRNASYWLTLIRFQDLLIWDMKWPFFQVAQTFRNNSFHIFLLILFFFNFHFLFGLFSLASVLINCQHDDRFMEKRRTGEESFLRATIVLKHPFSQGYFVFLLFFYMDICTDWLDGSSCLGNRNVGHVVP